MNGEKWPVQSGTDYRLLITDYDNDLVSAIYSTIRYFDLFDQPVTVVQIWQYLLLPGRESQERWGGRRRWHLSEVREALLRSGKLRQQCSQRWGYYYLAGRDELAKERLARHRLAQMKWKLSRRIVWWLQYVPFVRMIAISGSLAAGNTRPTSDLDLFVIVRAGRIWLARLGLMVVTQVLGRRRTYWDRQAPDKVCLNHYVTDQSLLIDSDIHNVYTAILYSQMMPVVGHRWYERFRRANDNWIKSYVMAADPWPLPPRLAVRASAVAGWLYRGIEQVLDEPVFNWLEHAAERLQRRLIARHTRPHQAGRVVVSNTELAFHPDTKVPGLLARFAQDEGQGMLL